MKHHSYQHWQWQQDPQGIVWLTLDRQNSSANSLNRKVLEELNSILDEMISLNPSGMIVQSGKPKHFIVGADIEQFSHLKSVPEAVSLIRQGQQIFDKLATVKFPTLALIRGFCLGGGFELALACRYRLADDDAKTKIGLPEILLGIHPGWGGTIRLPKLIGAIPALTAILSGKLFDAKTAAKMGMIDAAVPLRHLQTAARDFILQKPAAKQASKLAALSNHSLIRPLLGKIIYTQTLKKASPQHYPAPFAVIKNWVEQGVDTHQAMVTEAQSIGELLLTDTCKNLVRVFYLQERLKGLAKGIHFNPLHVHVIGSGTMGREIAAVCAMRGMRVSIQDRDIKLLGPAIKNAYELFSKRYKKQQHLIQQAMDRLIPDAAGNCLATADVIIEAVYEDLSVKQNLFKEIEARAKPSAILATNTSSIPLDEINKALKHPERLVGIHFFNPVSKMQLVEVVAAQQTDATVVQHAIAFVRKIDKLPLPVKSSPGFLINRILIAYLTEAMNLHADGVPIAVIDKAAVEFGMPMGPFTLMDVVGLDVGLSVAKYLTSALGGEIPSILQEKVGREELGQKTGKGFYQYSKKGKKIKQPIAKDYQAPNDITIRLILRMINESFSCLREGVVADADLLDIGMIFGTGFAPFRGGPMHYSEAAGIEKFRQKMITLQEKYGERFKLDQAWDSYLQRTQTETVSTSS